MTPSAASISLASCVVHLSLKRRPQNRDPSPNIHELIRLLPEVQPPG